MTLQDKYNEWRKTKHGKRAFFEFCRIALLLLERGRKHYSSDAISHVIRFHRDIGPDKDGFKMNDHYTAYMARELMGIGFHPNFDSFFETRRLSTEK